MSTNKRLTPEFAPGETPGFEALGVYFEPYTRAIAALPFLLFACESIIAFSIRRSHGDTDFIIKMVFGQLLALNSFLGGLAHFMPSLHEFYTSMIFLPFKNFWLYSTGLLLMVAGVGITFSQTQVFAAWMLVFVFILMFPGNIACVFLQRPRKIVCDDSYVKALLRLPLQYFFVSWALWFTSPPLSIPW